MFIVENVKDIREIVKREKRDGKKIGFVPTMGYLHEGHLSLIRRAKEENDFVVVSVFVNPTQFCAGEDFETYPRSLERDSKLAQSAGADILFNPSAKEMYPNGYKTDVVVNEITDKLCGASRPGHFKGVTTVVCKFFNIVQPDRAYFGQKDAQQVVVIEQMVKDLNMDLEIVPCPIVREEDGLALSSRNTYLNEKERKAGLILSKSLFAAKDMIENGERDAIKIKDFIIKNISNEPMANIDYVEVVSAENLEDIKKLQGDVLIALAVKIGKTRLIDNIRIKIS
ncbi:pantoate--beta-alanine ligase [Crassaminicella thermophila]|uniref:Pantothenate synthetase n=1 Tax=Crassaminicella thermophila TaxID=2599308 RepID=A0A5C0SGU4_CRATE|nr:pantoate--beta-alanine ligase [Crassaminicella thermophila]QEK12877.1 pantoate--beta-alanine ligase [Crassaminicella thermophila]